MKKPLIWTGTTILACMFGSRDEKAPQTVRLDTDLDGAPRPCTEYLLQDAIKSPGVMNLLKRCKIELIACTTGEALRLHY